METKKVGREDFELIMIQSTATTDTRRLLDIACAEVWIWIYADCECALSRVLGGREA